MPFVKGWKDYRPTKARLVSTPDYTKGRFKLMKGLVEVVFYGTKKETKVYVINWAKGRVRILEYLPKPSVLINEEAPIS